MYIRSAQYGLGWFHGRTYTIFASEDNIVCLEDTSASIILVFLPFPYETGVGELCVPAFDLTLQSALVH